MGMHLINGSIMEVKMKELSIHKLYEKYPELKIDLMLEERVLDLPMREADVAIRMKEPSQADLIRKRLMTVKMRLFASPKYLEIYGTPESEIDMKNHRLICQNPRSAQVSSGLSLVQRLMTQEIPSMLTVNNYFGVLQAVIHDLGIGVLPDYVTQEFDGVVPVLEEVQSNDVPVYLAFPEELRHSKRIEAFRDFVQSEIVRLLSVDAYMSWVTVDNALNAMIEALVALSNKHKSTLVCLINSEQGICFRSNKFTVNNYHQLLRQYSGSKFQYQFFKCLLRNISISL